MKFKISLFKNMILISQPAKKLESGIKMNFKRIYNFLMVDLCCAKPIKDPITMNKNVIYKINLLKEIFLNFL